MSMELSGNPTVNIVANQKQSGEENNEFNH
jgi:hypothetical protein